jgi:para-nitrobenzyl esterase
MISRRQTLMTMAATAALARPARAIEASPRVQTTHGPVIGARVSDILTFKGVRYGADTRPRRFQRPRRPEPWSDPVPALSYGAACPQTGGEPDQSEDCLFLNVWTPGADSGLRPVMVYMHGGAYSTGSGSSPLYDGTRLATRGDVVVVTLNHRLNLFGYAYLTRLDPRFAYSGNVGQWDLVLALEWVRDNIAAFGGDPDRVMVFGQSGGGAKIATLMATPAADGLFHSAATMSGQQVTASGPMNATRRTQAWLSTLGLGPDGMQALLNLPAQTLLDAAQITDPILGYGRLYFGPVLDHRMLFRHPFYPDAPAQSAAIPMIIGNTRDETLAFLGNDPANANLTWDNLPSRMTPEVMRIDVAPEEVIEAYRRIHPDWSPDEVLIGASTAARSWRGAIIEAEARAIQGAPTWVYQLDFPGRLNSGRVGAFHTVDIPLAFDTIGSVGSPVSGLAAQSVASFLSGAFVSLARFGDPNGRRRSDWARYSCTARQTLIVDDPCRVESDPRSGERQLFASYPYLQPGT